MEDREAFILLSLSVCENFPKIVMGVGLFSSRRSETIIPDAFHSGRAGGAVPLPPRCLPRDHQASLPGDQARGPGGVRHRVSEYRGDHERRDAAVHPEGAEAVDPAVQGQMQHRVLSFLRQ